MTVNVEKALSVCKDPVTNQYQDVLDLLRQALTIVFQLEQQHLLLIPIPLAHQTLLRLLPRPQLLLPILVM